MAYLSPLFDYDVFVSFSVGDMLGEREAPLARWTDRLIRDLENEIQLRSPDLLDLRIWHDRRLDPSIPFSDEIKRILSRSGILMVVMSPQYLASHWCKEEGEWFSQLTGGRAADSGRVLVVAAMPTEQASWPVTLRTGRGYPLPAFRFYDHHTDRTGPSPVPYRWRDSRDGEEAYSEEMSQLQRALSSRLRQMRADAMTETADKPRLPSGDVSRPTRRSVPQLDVAAGGNDTRQPKGALIGLLVDVSQSMLQSIGDAHLNRSVSRLDGVKEAIRGLADKLSSNQREAAAEAARGVDVFALGFGFGNPFSKLFNTGPAVRDLLRSRETGEPLVSALDLSDNWPKYEAAIRAMASEMFGTTPLKAALLEANSRFAKQQSRTDYRQGSWLLIISDGAPTDGSPTDIVTIASRIENAAVVIVSCFVAATDTVVHRRLFAEPVADWSAEARLMFNCASIIDKTSELYDYFKELGWTVDDDGRLFAQANHTELIAELVGALSRITGAPSQPSGGRPAAGAVDVFLSYAREDAQLAEQLAQWLMHTGVSVWWDREMGPGARYDDKILEKLDAATAVVVIWTDQSVGSDWVKYEAQRAHAARKLIPVRGPDLNPEQIPPPYPAVLHVSLIDDKVALLESLREHGVEIVDTP